MCSIILRKVFGVAGAAHTNHMNFKFRFAWPSADTGSLPFEGGIEAAYKSEISQSRILKNLSKTSMSNLIH